VASDDGIVIRAPGVDARELEDALRPGAVEARELVLAALGESPLFATRFRECASRALLVPRRLPGRRMPLWVQRLRAQDLLAVAARFPDFPITLEAFREVLEDDFDLRAMTELLDALEKGSVRLVAVTTAVPSPLAAALASEQMMAFLETASAPRAERRAQALGLDRSLLRELLGHDDMRELVSAEVLAALERELARLERVESSDALFDLLLALGPLDRDEVAARVTDPHLLEELLANGRVVARGERFQVKDEPATPRDLVRRFARTHGPFTEEAARARLELDPREALLELEREGTVLRGGFRPGGHGGEWIEKDVLARLRRRSLAALRAEIEPQEPEALGRFLPRWHGVPRRRRGVSGVLESVKQLEGCPLPASVLESDLLPARVADYAPWMLDELAASGEIAWRGHGPGKLFLLSRARLALFPPEGSTRHPLAPALRERLARRGAAFFLDLIEQESFEPVLEALWELVWAGEVVADSFLPLRGWLDKGKSRSSHRVAARVPAPAAGRWQLTPFSMADSKAPDESAIAADASVNLFEPGRGSRSIGSLSARLVAERLLERHGVLTREAALAEGVPGGWAGLYPMLSALEGAGRVRRGNFVRGVDGAQFALPGAVDRLREAARGTEVVLAAADPANPWGAALPAALARKPGMRVVLADGALVLAHSTKALLTFTRDEALRARAVRALGAAVDDGLLRRVEVVTVDGSPLLGSPLERVLRAAGFVSTGRGVARDRPSR
jgi:ATP-dependent Lhr-like helicase